MIFHYNMQVSGAIVGGLHFLVVLRKFLGVQIILSCWNNAQDELLANNPALSLQWWRIVGQDDVIAFASDWNHCARDGIRCLILCEEDLTEVVKQEAWTAARMNKSETRMVVPRGVVLLLPHDDTLVYNYSLRLDSHLITYSVVEGNLVHLYKWYGLRTTNIHYHLLATWARGDDIPVSDYSLIWVQHSQTNFNGTLLSISRIEFVPAWFTDKAGNANGSDFEILTAVQASLNFQVNIVYPPDGNYGMLENDKWNGIVGQLEEGSVDISASFGMSAERVQVVDFCQSIYSIQITLFTGDTDYREGVNTFAFINIFNTDVWAVLALTMLVISYGYAIASKVMTTKLKFTASLFSGFFSSFLSLIQKSSGYIITNASLTVSIISFTVNLGFYLIFAIYTCDLTAMMTVGIPPPRLNSFRDVSEAELTLVYVKDGLEESILSSGKDGSYMKELYLKRSKATESMDDLIHEIIASNGKAVGFAAHVYYTRNKVKPLTQFSDAVHTYGSFAFPKGSDLVEPFCYNVLRQRERGLVKNIKHKWFGNRAPRDYSSRIFLGIDATPLGYLNLIFPYLILGGGILSSLVVGFFEKYILRCGAAWTTMHGGDAEGKQTTSDKCEKGL